MMRTYDSYKDSGIEWIGEIPRHWECERGKYLFNYRKELNSSLQETNLLSLTIHGVLRKDMFSNDGLRPLDYSTYQIFEKHNLVFKLIDLENISTSRVGLVHERGIMSPVYIRIESNENILPSYSYYYYYDLYKQSIFNNLGSGVRSSLTSSNLLDMRIPLPPISEQEQIVSYLDEKTSLIDKLIESMLKEEKLLIESIVSYLFVNRIDNSENISFGNYWFQSIPQNWEIVKLKDLFKVKDVKNNNERLVSVTQENGVVFRDEQKGDVMNPSGDTSNYKLIEENDFVISLRSSEGGFEVSFIKGLVSPVYTVLEPKLPIDTIFYKYLFKSENFITELNRYIKGIRDGKNIHFNDVRDLPIPYNPNLSNSIIETHKQIYEKFDKNKQYIELLKEYRKSLISEVVTGKIKVVSE